MKCLIMKNLCQINIEAGAYCLYYSDIASDDGDSVVANLNSATDAVDAVPYVV